MLSLLYSTVLLYYICFCFVLSCTLLIGGNKEILLLLFFEKVIPAIQKNFKILPFSFSIIFKFTDGEGFCLNEATFCQNLALPSYIQ